MGDTFYKAIMSFYLRDADGQNVGLPLYLNVRSDQTAEEILNELIAVGTLVNNLTGCAIYEAALGVFAPQVMGWRPSPGIGSKANVGAVIKFGTTIPNIHYPIVIPAILASKLSGNHLNTGDADVQAFINWMVAVGRPFEYTDKGGAQLDTFAASFLNVRKSAPDFRRMKQPV